MPNDNLKNLYQTVKDEGLYTKSYDEFQAQYSTPESRQKIYGVVKEQGLYTKSYDEFDAKYWGGTPQQVEQKKNNEGIEVSDVASTGNGQAQTSQTTQTDIMGGGNNISTDTRTIDKVKPTHYQNFVNTYRNTQEQSNLNKTGYKMFDANGETAIESIPKPVKANVPETKKVVKSDIGGVQTYFEAEAPVFQNQTVAKPDDTKRIDGTDKGKGFYGEITIQDKEDKGKTMTELSAGYEVDGKEIEVPLLNPYTSLDDIENVRAGGQPSEQMYKDAGRWLDYSLKNNRSPFATEEETINVYTDEDNKIKFQTPTDLQKYVASNQTEDDRKVLVGEPNPYVEGTQAYQDFANKEASRDMLNDQMEQFSKDTGYAPEAYFDYQDYLINGGTSFEDWNNSKTKQKYNPQSKIGVDEALALTVATLPTLVYDVVFRGGDMIKRIGKGTGEFATGIRSGSVMGDISYITQGLFTLTKEGKYNPFKAAGELKQTDTEWVNRFDRNAKDEVAMFMGSIGVDYMPFEAAGNLTNKMIQTLTKANAMNYYNMAVKTGVLPESAMGISEKIVTGGMQMGGTLGLYTGAQSTLNQLMNSTPEEFLTEGLKTILNDATSSALTGFVAGAIGGGMGVLTNQVKNKIISDAMKNGILDASKLQKFAYVGTGVAGGTLSTILEASTFVAMSGEELNAKNILKESIKFAMLKFQNPAGLKIDKMQNKTMIDPNFTPDKAWKGKFELKLNEAELDMLGCKDVAEVRELVQKEGIDAVSVGIPTSTAFKLANAEYGIVVPAKVVDFAPDDVTITTENINGKEYSVVNTWNKQGELTHVSPHENYQDAATEVELITNKMQEYKVYKAADRLKPEWYAEFNQTAKTDKIALNDALQAANTTPDQTNVIKEFNKEVDDFIAKKEKETPNEKPKKKEVVEKVAQEVKEEVVTLNDKEYTIREKEVFVKNEQGLLTRETDNDIIKQVKEKQNDTQDKAGLQGSEQKGETVVEGQPIETTSTEKTETSGDVQTPKEKDLIAAKDISQDVTKINTVQKEKELRNKKEVDADIELNNLVEKKTKDVMNDIKADYDGVIKLGNRNFLIKKKSRRNLEVFITNENGNLIPIDDAVSFSFMNKNKDITPMSESYVKKIKNLAFDKFVAENEKIVDEAYKEIDEYRAEQYDIIQERVDAEILQEISKYQTERDKLYNEGSLKAENVDIPKNIEKQKSNFAGDLKKTNDIETSLSNVRSQEWFKKLNGDTKDVVHAMLRDLGEKQLKTVGKEAKMTKAEISPAGEEVLNIKRSDYLKDLESISKKGIALALRQVKKGVRDLKKFTEEDFKTFINDIRKAHAEVSEFLTPAENKTILTQIESGVKADTKARGKSIEKIGEILEKAQDRLVESDIASMEKSFDNFLETTKVNKQKKQVEGKTTKEFTDFAKKVKETALQEPDAIETKLEDAYEKIITGTEVESDAAKLEVEALVYAQDYSTFNQNKAIFENPSSTRTDKMIAYYEMMDIYDKFLSKNPAETYKAAVDAKMKIIEKEKADTQKKIEIMQNPDLKVEDIPKVKELFDITDNFRISTKNKDLALNELSKIINDSKTISPKNKSKLNNAIKNVRNNPLVISKDSMANRILKPIGLTKLQKDVTREKSKLFTNPLRRALNRFDNLQQIGKILGWTNREIRDYFTELTDKADEAAIKADKMTSDKLKDVTVLKEMIYGNKELLTNWTNRTEKLGVQETLVDSEGKPFTDFNKLSYNDILYMDRLLRTPQNKEIISKVYGEDAVNILQKHCGDVMKMPELKEISDYVFEELQQKIYEINNEQYVKENGVDLAWFDDYVARFAVKTDKVMGKTDVKGSLKPSATRVRSIARQIKTDVNVVDMIDKAYSEAIKYNAFSDVNTEMRRVLMNDKVKNTILVKVAEGDVVWKNLNKLYEAYPEGVKINDTIVPKIISNAVIAKLRMNPTMILKQASSASNSYADYIKTINNQKLNYVPGLVEAMYAKDLLPDKYTGQFLKSAMNNKALRTRLQSYGIDPHLADYMQKTFIEMGLDKIGVTKNANTIKFFNALETFKDVQGLPVKYGDMAAFWGAKPLFNIFYKKALKEGMTKEQAGEYAIDNAYKPWAKTNQSTWSHNMSAFQLSPVGKLFAYYTSPIQMGQQLRGSIRDILAPSSTTSERVNGAKTFAYYVAFQKTIFMLAGAASTGLVKYMSKSIGQMLGYNTNPDDSFDDLAKVLDIPEEKLDVISKILQHQSATQGIPVLDELTTIVADAMKEGRYSDRDIIATIGMIEKSIGSNVGKITDIISKKGFDSWSDKEKREVVRFASQIGDMLTGYGVSPSNRILEYVTGKDILNDAENSKKEETSPIGSGDTKIKSSPVIGGTK